MGDCEQGMGDCEYRSGLTKLDVLEGDNFIIPVEYGDLFSLKSAEIQAQRP